MPSTNFYSVLRCNTRLSFGGWGSQSPRDDASSHVIRQSYAMATTWYSRRKDHRSKLQRAVLVRVEQAVYTAAQQYRKQQQPTFTRTCSTNTLLLLRLLPLCFSMYTRAIHVLPCTYMMVTKTTSNVPYILCEQSAVEQQ